MKYTVTFGDGLRVWCNGELVHEVTDTHELMFIAWSIMNHLYKGK